MGTVKDNCKSERRTGKDVITALVKQRALEILGLSTFEGETMSEHCKNKGFERQEAELVKKVQQQMAQLTLELPIIAAQKNAPMRMTELLNNLLETDCGCPRCKMRAYMSAGFREAHKLMTNELPGSCEEEEVSTLLYTLWLFVLFHSDFFYACTKDAAIEEVLEQLNSHSNTPKLVSFKVPPSVLEDGGESFMKAVQAVVECQAENKRGN